MKGEPPVADAPPAPLVLTPEFVRPLARSHALEPTPARFELDTRDALPAPVIELDAASAHPIAAARGTRTPRRALIVDDSLVARMGLARVLEREGWEVEGVERAEQMWPLMKTTAWTVVFVDVSLPDANGREHLRALVAQQLAASQRFELVALTRDGAERRLADEAGITRTLAQAVRRRRGGTAHARSARARGGRMIPSLPGMPRELPLPLVLVADEDARVVELLAFAFKANHFRVSSTQDGDEALRRAQTEKPDLVVADVRLPKRGGLELCDLLRRDPDHGDVPILLLSAANDTEARVEAFAHGADGFMSKPFSPKELIARAQRLVSRSREAARHAQRSTQLERDLGKLQGEARSAREEAERERGLRALAGGMMGELLRTLDLDELDGRLLREVCRQTGARSAALLAAEGSGLMLPVAVRGDLFERWAGLSLPGNGACVEWLCVLGRPVRRDEFDRLPEPPREVAQLAAHGVSLLAAVRNVDGGVEALIACEDRADGESFSGHDRERLATLCAAAAPARATARHFREQQDRVLTMLGAQASADPRRREVARESHERLVAAATAFGMTSCDLTLLKQALDLGPWAWSDIGRTGLESLACGDPTRRLRVLCQLLSGAEASALGDPGASEDVLALLTAAGLRYQSLRLAGRSPFEAWRTAVSWIGLHADPLFRDCFPEATEPAR